MFYPLYQLLCGNVKLVRKDVLVNRDIHVKKIKSKSAFEMTRVARITSKEHKYT